jgi:hypothetical protein
MDNVYTMNGYKNRRDYLENLASDMGIDKETVFSLASILGSGEDFDGLISNLEDHQDWILRTINKERNIQGY